MQVLHLYISYGIIAGAGQGIINIISLTILDPNFHKHKRTACSIALSGYGFGSFLVPPILTFLEDVFGWRGAILLLAGINAHMMVTCSLFRPFATVLEQKEICQACGTVLSNDREKSSKNGVSLPLKAVPHVEENPGPERTIKVKGLEMLLLFRGIPFLCLSACTLIIVLSTSIIVTHFGSYLLTLNFTSKDVLKLYMTLGISATVARPMAGIVAEITHANTALYMMLTILLNGI